MKKIKQLMVLMSILLLCIGFSACSVQRSANNPDDEEEPQSQDNEAIDEPIESDPLSLPYSFDIEGNNWDVEGITLKYPMIINSNMQDKADEANDLIMNDLSEVIEIIKSDVDDETLTIDGTFNYSNLAPTTLSISYYIEYSADSLSHPINLFHTITISLDQVSVISLSDLFTIDESFVESFKTWMYAPYRDDLDLEASGVTIYDEIGKLYSNKELIKLFKQADAQYYLTDQGLILSIGVPPALGDHLEMAMSYEFLEAYIKRDHPLWQNYMYLGGDDLEGTVNSFISIFWTIVIK